MSNNFTGLQNFSNGGINPIQITIPKNNSSEPELFGEFKSAPTQTNDKFIELNNKLDNIMYKIGLLMSEIKDIKQQNFQQPRPIIYPMTPQYPGQPMPPYPHQQMLYGQQNYYPNSK